jgi:hypothetical protein
MDQEALRQFARRDWSAAAQAKRDYWAEAYRRFGSGVARRTSTRLLDHARSVHPGFPTDEDRAHDLRHHVEFRERLDRAARALSCR